MFSYEQYFWTINNSTNATKTKMAYGRRRSYKKKFVRKSRRSPYAKKRTMRRKTPKRKFTRKSKYWTQKLSPWPHSVRMPAFAGAVLRATSVKHHKTGYLEGFSSAAAVTNPCTYRFHASLNTGTSSNAGPGMGWTTVTDNAWGSENYGTGYVNTERYFLHHIRFKFSFQNQDENGKVRLTFANPTQRTQQTPTFRYNWNPNIDEPQNPHYWDVKKTYMIDFSDNRGSNTATLNRSRDIDITVPVNKWFNTKTGSAASAVSTWDAIDWNQEFMFFIDSNDGAATDFQSFRYLVYIDHVFSLANA